MLYRGCLSTRCSTGDVRSRTTTVVVVPKGSPVPPREVDRFRSARAALVSLVLLVACSPSVPVPQPVSLTGTITNWNSGTPPYEAGALAGRDALALELSPWVTGEVDAAGYLDVTYAIPEGTWGAPLTHLFDDPNHPAVCTDLIGVGLDQPTLVIQALFHEVHGGAIIRYDATDDAVDLMVYVESPATVTATECHVLLWDVAVDVDLAVGWNRVRVAQGEGALLDGHDVDAVWIWD